MVRRIKRLPSWTEGRDTSLSPREWAGREEGERKYICIFCPSPPVTIERANPKSESGESSFVAPDSGLQSVDIGPDGPQEERDLRRLTQNSHIYCFTPHLLRLLLGFVNNPRDTEMVTLTQQAGNRNSFPSRTFHSMIVLNAFWREWDSQSGTISRFQGLKFIAWWDTICIQF